jgi:hypothetical protein
MKRAFFWTAFILLQYAAQAKDYVHPSEYRSPGDKGFALVEYILIGAALYGVWYLIGKLLSWIAPDDDQK